MLSKIEWCDETLNITAGCTKASAGCTHCYAERMARRLTAMGNKNYAHIIDDGTPGKQGTFPATVSYDPDGAFSPYKHWDRMPEEEK